MNFLRAPKMPALSCAKFDPGMDEGGSVLACEASFCRSPPFPNAWPELGGDRSRVGHFGLLPGGFCRWLKSIFGGPFAVDLRIFSGDLWPVGNDSRCRCRRPPPSGGPEEFGEFWRFFMGGGIG